MLRNTFSHVLASLPPDLKSMPSMQGMMGGIKPPIGDPTALDQDELSKFGNWTGQSDPKVKAQSLKDLGLIGAQQLVEDAPNINDPNSIRNSQSDWKTAAIEQIISNAKKFNLRTPEEINANRDALIGNSDWRKAINSKDFNVIHPNFWQVLTHSLIPAQYAKFDKQNSLAKK